MDTGFYRMAIIEFRDMGTEPIIMRTITRVDALQCVGPGWSSLIHRAYNARPIGVHITDVKEKFGGLRICVDTAPDDYYDLLWDMIAESETICEMCGQPGTLRANGWWKTLCDECKREN